MIESVIVILIYNKSYNQLKTDEIMKDFLILTLFLLSLTFISASCNSGQIDINSASLEELDKITQIGPARAEQMITLRPFSSVDDMIRIIGIGETNINLIKSQGLACVEEESDAGEEESSGEIDVNNETNTVNESSIINNNLDLNSNNSSNNNIQLETINLDTKAIKTAENSEVSDNNNLAIYGLFAFAGLLGLLFLIKGLIKQKRYKNGLA